MVQARIRDGRVEVQDPIPAAWEGQFVKIVPLSPDDPSLDLGQRLAELHALGPIEYLPGEQDAIDRELAALNYTSRASFCRTGLVSRLP